MVFHPHGWAAGPWELRRKSRLNPFGINRPWKCGFHLHGWAAGPWELTTQRAATLVGRLQGRRWCKRLLNEAALRQKNRKSFRSINWVITLRRRYDDPTSTTHARRAPAAKLLRWNHSIVPPARRRIRPTFSSPARSARSRGYSSVPTVPDSGKKAGVVKLQPDRVCAAILLCQDVEACVPAVGHSFLTAAATASSDPQSGGGGKNTHRSSASQKSCPVDDRLRGRLAALRGGSLASERHRLGAHDHYGSSRQRAKGSSGHVVSRFVADPAAVLSTCETKAMALSRGKP